jgi:hypothetical protein
MRWLQQPEVCALQLWARGSSHLPGNNYGKFCISREDGVFGDGAWSRESPGPCLRLPPPAFGAGTTPLQRRVVQRAPGARGDKGNRACLLLPPAEFTHCICTPAHRADPAAAVISRQAGTPTPVTCWQHHRQHQTPAERRRVCAASDALNGLPPTESAAVPSLHASRQRHPPPCSIAALHHQLVPGLPPSHRNSATEPATPPVVGKSCDFRFSAGAGPAVVAPIAA